MKKLIAIFFLCIISVQCLPLKELCKKVFDTNIVEDNSMCEDGIEKKDVKDFCKEFYVSNDSADKKIILNTLECYSIYSDIIVQTFTEITTPPPNA
ncbi:MAG: hypothetical protein HOO89_09595 [Ferruginibacter sp.]|nr:hypothetical protein [Ferruginibacter sp.]